MKIADEIRDIGEMLMGEGRKIMRWINGLGKSMRAVLILLSVLILFGCNSYQNGASFKVVEIQMVGKQVRYTLQSGGISPNLYIYLHHP